MNPVNNFKIDLINPGSLFSSLMQSSSIVFYAMDLSPVYKNTFITENISNFTGYAREDLLRDHFWIAHLHQEYRQLVLDQFRVALKRKQQSLVLEYPFRVKNGHYRWIRDSAELTYSNIGRPLRLVGCWVDISKQKEAEADLDRARRELEQFIYTVSHDFKEPLRGIHNYIQFLLEDYAGRMGIEGSAKLESVKALSQRMDGMISSLLKISRLGQGNLCVQSSDLNAVLTQVCEKVKITLHAAKAEIRIPRPLPEINCDPSLLNQLYTNLIINAVQYNDNPHKCVEIGYFDNTQDNTKIDSPVFYVRDNGIGIRDKDFESIFRIFRRLHTRQKYGGGIGAGLTLVKKIIERHHGKIWVESKPSEGTTFYFTLQTEHEDSYGRAG